MISAAPDPSSTHTRRDGLTSRDVLRVAALCAVALALRFYRLDWQGLWHDEAGSAAIARAPLAGFLDFFQHRTEPFELNPPVYYLLLRAWTSVVGTGDIGLRSLSAVAGASAVPLAWRLGLRLFGRRAAFYGATLVAVSQLGVMFSQEARAYALVAPLWLIVCEAFVASRAHRSVRAWLVATVAAVLMVGTHYYAALGVLALALFTVLRWRAVPVRWVAGAAAAALASIGPWVYLTLPAQLAQAQAAAGHAYYAVQMAAPLTLLNRLNNGALAGVLDPAPRWTFVAGAWLFVVPIVLFLARTWRTADTPSRDAALFAVLACGVPACGGIAAAWVAHVQYDVRYVAYAAAPYGVLAGAALAALPHARLRQVALGLAVVYSLIALRANYALPYKEDYRGAIRFVDAHAAPSDCVAFAPFGVRPLQWPLYASRTNPTRVTLTSAATDVAACPRLWLFTYTRVDVDTMTDWDAWRASTLATWRRASTTDFFWVSVDEYVAPTQPIHNDAVMPMQDRHP